MACCGGADEPHQSPHNLDSLKLHHQSGGFQAVTKKLVLLGDSGKYYFLFL